MLSVFRHRNRGDSERVCRKVMYGLGELGGIEYPEVAVGAGGDEVIEWGPGESPDGIWVD